MTWEGLFDYFRSSGLNHWAQHLESEQDAWLVQHGDYARWAAALATLPEIDGISGLYDHSAVTVAGECVDSVQLQRALEDFIPWRKGPYQIADIFIDTEWRSDLKWERVQPHLTPLQDRRILDIGCGNGYYGWRMLAHNPALVLGIEPSVLFNFQFQVLQNYLQRKDFYLLPLGVEAVPQNLNWFDTLFSMGVLYHRKSPIDHLYQLKSFLVDGGELCLETLVIEGDEGQVLVPEERYARMRNVWFIPSAQELLRWLQRCGFVNIRLVDETVTTLAEQRVTEWMQFESLEQCLDPENPGLTVEGLPAPRRAIVIANKP